MKVKFVLYSYEFKDVEHEDYCLANPICCDWKHPFLPRKHDQIQLGDFFPEELKKLGLPEKRFWVMETIWHPDHVTIWCEGNF